MPRIDLTKQSVWRPRAPWIIIFCYAIEGSFSFNIESRDANLINAPSSDTINDISSSYFGYNFIMRNQSSAYKALIGSPKSRQPADKPIATAPYLKAQYDEQYASGTLHSCPLQFTSQPSACTPARPSTPIDPTRINNRDALGFSIGNDGSDPDVAVCTPNEAIRCAFSYFVVGSCYHSTDFGKTWSPPTSGPNINCNAGTTDLIFALDSSGSINQHDPNNYERMKNWTIEITSSFPTDSSFYMGVLIYSTNIYPTYETKYPIQFQPFTNRTMFNEEVKNLEYLRGFTFTARTVNKALDILERSPRRNQNDNNQIILLITDGLANDNENLQAAGQRARDLGVEILAVRIGLNQYQELERLTGTKVPSPQIFQVSDFSDLNSIVQTLQIAITSLEGLSNAEHNNLQQSQSSFSTKQASV